MTKFFSAVVILLATSGALATPQPDNTATNARDRNDSELTAGSQGMNTSDTDITAKIRRAIVEDKSLSFTAHNVKIITVNGQVTLKGPVRSAQEKASVVAKASGVVSTSAITDQLEVAKSE